MAETHDQRRRVALTAEPRITVGISEGNVRVTGTLEGRFFLEGAALLEGAFSAEFVKGEILLRNSRGQTVKMAPRLFLHNDGQGVWALDAVKIGKDFHWERYERQRFPGSLILQAAGGITVINEVGLEDYLSIVISSEMSAEAPKEFLQAQAVVARSWTVASLRRNEKDEYQQQPMPGEVVRWYGRGRHDLFDFCADDHCQRYHGLGRSFTSRHREAATQTHGLFLTSGGQICDARYHKACGGFTERFSVAWEDEGAPYLVPIADFPTLRNHCIRDEDSARAWLTSTPTAYCNITAKELLAKVLPYFDQETGDFFRWQVVYRREELEEILREKAGIEIGELRDIVPLQRGASGRISRLRLVGAAGTFVVGKELEIRRILSRSHLYSSAFVVEKRGNGVRPEEFVLNGGGWGHGVGFCQLGAANMASQGFGAEEILRHYFPCARLEKLY